VSIASGREAIPAGALESWTALYRRSPWAGAIANNLFDAVLSETYRQLLARGAQMYLAVNPANPDQWLGYQLVERTSDGVPVVHAAFTKSTYRRAGVQASLFAASGIDRTGRLFYTMRCGPESKFYPAGRYTPEVARRKAA
jgi:hypothetical protein